jgi:hypothetical protein
MCQETFNFWVTAERVSAQNVIGDCLVSPHVLPYCFTGNHYFDFLLYDLPSLLKNVPVVVRARVGHMHDGAPIYFSRDVRDVNNTYHDQWIGRRGATAWPPLSSVLNPLNVYLWGNLETLVYAVAFDNEEAIHHRILDARQTVPTTAGSLNGCGGPWWDVSWRAFNFMEVILGTHYGCTLSTKIRKLNICGHMLLWIFHNFGMLNSFTNLSSPFSYTI